MRKLFLALFVFSAACAVPLHNTQVLNRRTSESEGASESLERSQKEQMVKPVEVERCLAKTETQGNVDILVDQDPRHYLKGDFDGDGLPDFAVAVKGSKTRRNGVLICTGKDRVFILGADNPTNPPFSDMPNDNFVAPQWKVYTNREAANVHTIDKEAPAQIASPKGDSIAMIWEDGICLIYWDGNRYRWGCGQ